MQPGSHGGGFFDNEEQLIAAIERDVGPEAAEATRRSRRLARNPRALTGAERAELRAALEPVLRDMRGSGAIVPQIREEAHDDLGPDCVCAWIQTPGSAGSQGFRVQVSLPAPERLADLADQLQEWEVEELAAAGRSATWPQCPLHPDSHPLSPRPATARRPGAARHPDRSSAPSEPCSPVYRRGSHPAACPSFRKSGRQAGSRVGCAEELATRRAVLGNLADIGDILAVPREIQRCFGGIDLHRTDLTIGSWDFRTARNCLACPETAVVLRSESS